ncbi:MAG TPA: ATP-binding protein [Roseiflexaceae bacterium]|nr:ATP-binding protein [Roseiflexaceae bacterium]
MPMARNSSGGRRRDPSAAEHSPAVADLQARVQALEAELARAQSYVGATTARIAELEAQVSALRWAQGANTSGRLSALLAICAALLVTREVETILQLVVRESVALFPGASGALVFLADAEGRELHLRAASSGRLPRLVLAPGTGIAGRAYLAPRAMLMVGPELELALADLDDAQPERAAEVLQPWPPSSALLAPLRIEGQRLGALVLYGSTHAHLFHPRDLPFVQALGDLAAVAIAESRQRDRAARLQRDLDQTQSLHAEARARLDAAQAQLLQSAKLAAVGELAASVAHEINNPLYAARNSLYLIEQDLPPDAVQRPFLQIAQTELGRIARIITRMRDFYRPARDELEPTEVNDLLAETIELVQTHLRHGQVAVVTDFAPDLPTLTAHPDQLRQVFLNLMLNACDAMPHGGTLTVRTRVTDDRRPMIDNQQPATAHSPRSTVVVEVSDTGIGIPEEHLPHLFEPFYTTKPQGTGLGLAISAHIVTQHGGAIAVQSCIGQGTTFAVTLPASPPA